MASWKCDVIIMGDFNEVRYSNERFGSNFNVEGANAFNSFIIQAGLEEIPLGGWNASEEVIYNRLEIANSINELKKQQAMKTTQKAKIKWAIEDLVKKEFLNHFKNRFGRPNKTRHVLVTEFPRQLNSMQRMDMEADVTIEEIKNAVWDCVTDKSPGLNGFQFDFYRRF
nr:RNA-directed DNA polymerase, eukaryota [Tanacetum cinerariifolium]